MSSLLGKAAATVRAMCRSRRWRRVGVTLLILIVLIVLLRLTVLRPPKVMVATVRRGDVAAEVEGTGTVTADVLANVAARITGRVEQVFVDQGDVVHAGQLLATLDQTGWHQQVEVAKAHLVAAVATAKERRREWLREKTLVISGAVGVEESQIYQTRNTVAQNAVAAAKAELAAAEYNLSLTQIRALSDGVVTQRQAVPGDSVVPGQTTFTVADTDLIYVDAFIDQDSSGKVRKGQPAAVLLRGHAGRPLSGRVLRIRPRASAATEETVAEVAFRLPAADPFQIGQWANVYIKVGEAKDALVIPQTALMPVGNDLFVWVVGAGDRLRRERVTVMARSPRASRAAVSGALRAGERVALRPMGLRPGETVRPVPATSNRPMGAMR